MPKSKMYDLTTLYFPNRIIDRLSLINTYPMTIVEAPSGFGKTTAMREYFSKYINESIPIYWHTFLGETFSASWKSICNIFARIDPETTDQLLELGTPDEDNLTLIAEILENIECKEETYIVLDNFQDIKISFIQPLMDAFANYSSSSLHMIIITQQLSLGQTLLSKQNHRIYKVSLQDLLFTRADVSTYYKKVGLNITSKQLENVYLRSDGWIAALYLQMLTFVQTGTFESGDIQNLIRTSMWDKLSPDGKDALLSLSVFQSFTMAQLEFLTSNLTEETKVMVRENPFIRFDPETRHYNIHSILKDYLTSIFDNKTDESKKEIYVLAGDWFTKIGSYIEAIRFYHFANVADAYEKIFALARTGMNIVDNSVGTEIGPILSDMLDKTSEFTKLSKPAPMISVAFALFFLGENERMMRMVKEIYDVIDRSYVTDKEKNSLRGEMELLMSFMQYNKIDKMSEKHRKALELMDGPTNFIGNKSTWTFGSPSILYMYYRESGKLSEALQQMDECMPYYYKLSENHGSGAEIVMHAEAKFNEGLLDEAEILCHKALFVSDSKKQNCIYQCGLLLLARIAIMRADMSALVTVRASLHDKAKQNLENLSRYTLDLCEGFIHITLGEIENIPLWLSLGDKIAINLSMMTVPFAHIIYGRSLLEGKEYLKLIGTSAYTMGISNIFPNLLPQLYTKIYLAQAHEAIGNHNEAITILVEALEMALPDKLYMPFAENCHGLKKLLSIASQQIEDKYGLAKIDELSHIFCHAISKIKSDRPTLSEREQEVYALIVDGLTNKQIAEQLFVSPATIKTHVSHILEKTGATSRTQLWKQIK